MGMTTWTHRRSASALGGLLSAFAISSAAYAISSSAFTYDKPKNGFHTINHYQLAPKTSETQFTNSQSGLGVEEAGCFNTGVHLPDGAVIKTLTMSYRGTMNSVTMALLRQHFSNVSVDSIASLTGSDTGGDNSVKSIAAASGFATVDNKIYGYSIEVCMTDASDTFYAARIAYQYTSAGD